MERRTTTRRQLVAERARLVRNSAFGAGAVLLVLAAARDLLGGHGDAGTLGQVWQVLLQVAVALVFLAQAVRVGSQFPDGLHQPGDRRLPRWGHGARVAFRTFAGVAATAYLLWGALLISNFGGDDRHLVTDDDWVGGAMAVVIFLPGLAALASMLVWGASEVVSGYQEPRRRTTTRREPQP